jgi:hypothetical protein
VLLAAAGKEGFEVLITADQNVRYRQALANRCIALIVLETNNWAIIRADLTMVGTKLANAGVRTYASMPLNRPPLRRRPLNTSVEP